MVLTLDGSPAPGGGVGPDLDALDIVNAQEVQIRHMLLSDFLSEPLTGKDDKMC